MRHGHILLYVNRGTKEYRPIRAEEGLKMSTEQIAGILGVVIAVVGGAVAVRYRGLAGKIPKLQALMKELDEAMKELVDEKGEPIELQKMSKEKLEKVVKEVQDVYVAMKELLK